MLRHDRKVWIPCLLWGLSVAVAVTGGGLAAEPRVCFVHGSPVREIGFAPDGKRLAVATEKGNIVVWSTGTRVRQYEIDMGRERITDLAFSANSDMLAVATCRGQIVVFAFDEQSQPTRLESFGFSAQRRDCGVEVAFSSDEKLFATKTSISGCAIRSWDLRDGKEAFRKDFDELACGLALSTDTRGIWVATTDGPRLVEYGTGEVKRRLSGGIGRVEIAPDGRHLAAMFSEGVIVVQGHPMSVRVWDLKTGTVLGTLNGNYGHSMSFSRCSRFLAFAAATGSVEIIDIQQWRFLSTELHHPGGDLHIEFSPAENVLATSAEKSRVVKLWRLTSLGDTVTPGQSPPPTVTVTRSRVAGERQ